MKHSNLTLMQMLNPPRNWMYDRSQFQPIDMIASSPSIGEHLLPDPPGGFNALSGVILGVQNMASRNADVRPCVISTPQQTFMHIPNIPSRPCGTITQPPLKWTRLFQSATVPRHRKREYADTCYTSWPPNNKRNNMKNYRQPVTS